MNDLTNCCWEMTSIKEGVLPQSDFMIAISCASPYISISSLLPEPVTCMAPCKLHRQPHSEINHAQTTTH